MSCGYFIPLVPITGGLYPLKDDACRCYDEECPQREECDHWVQRRSGGLSCPRAFSMRKDGEP